MAKVNEHRYISFPIWLLRSGHKDINKVLNDILAYGVYYNALESALNDKSKVLMTEGAKFLKVDVKSNEQLKEWQTIGEQIYTLQKGAVTLKNKSYPISTIKVSMLESLIRENRMQPKKEKQIEIILCYLAIRSILGKRKCIKSNNKHVLSRMLGYASYDDLCYETEGVFTEDIEYLWSKYCKRGTMEISKDRMKTLIGKLYESWRILKVADNTRGFYVAYEDKISLKELARVVVNSKKKKAKTLDVEFKKELELLKRSA